MDQYDYKTINIPKGAELAFHRVFQTFGYRPILSEEVSFSRSTDGRIQGNADMEHYYLASEADEALLGLVLHRLDKPVDRYIRVTYGRNRFDGRFDAYSSAEAIYNRMTYDAYRLALKAKEHKRKSKLPILFSFLFWLLLVLGVVAIGVGYWKGGSAIPFMASFSAFSWGTAFWGGLIGFLAGFLCLVLIGAPIRIAHRTAMLRAADGYNTITGMKSDFRTLFRHSEDVPVVDIPTLVRIEKINKIQ